MIRPSRLIKKTWVAVLLLISTSGSGKPFLQDKQPVSPRREGIMQKYTYTSITTYIICI